ncbi:3-methyl-2-oxobutanoate hydroxymethyltransferase [bacterium]|nr:MAG: 3-methyl-2-oxobutanoate hydroxymethyltransferase [bacterium]
MSLFPLSVFKRKKDAKIPLAMVALSDAPSAQIASDAGIDAILVGDSLGNTALGFDSTIPVTMDMMAHHVAAVVRGVKSSTRPDVPVIGDLPFGSYATPEKGVENAVRLMQLGAHAVKVEGTQSYSRYRDGMSYEESPLFAALQAAGVPVMGHIGFTPQSQLVLGKVVQGKTRADAQDLWKQARSLEQSGCFAVVLEAMTQEIANKITEKSKIPTIGIGAGNGCDGQVLVWHDLVGISAKSLKMARAYAQTRQLWTEALQEYKSDVESKAFPTADNGWVMDPEELKLWQDEGLVVNEEYYDESLLTIEPFEGETFTIHGEKDRHGGWRPYPIASNNPDEDFDDSDPFADQ